MIALPDPLFHLRTQIGAHVVFVVGQPNLRNSGGNCYYLSSIETEEHQHSSSAPTLENP